MTLCSPVALPPYQPPTLSDEAFSQILEDLGDNRDSKTDDAQETLEFYS